MEYKEIQSLIKLIDSTNLTEFKMKEGEFEIMIRTKDYFKLTKSMSAQVTSVPVVHSAAPVPVVTNETESPVSQEEVKAAAPAAPATTESNDKKILDVKSPIVGTFYRSPSPDKGPYVKIGDHIDAGSIVCIVEAMKLFNEIESEVSGKLIEIMVEDSTPVEYDQVLFRVEQV
jgi:acetyl-CoA carboxylase biotin carboxyl carrier protein